MFTQAVKIFVIQKQYKNKEEEKVFKYELHAEWTVDGQFTETGCLVNGILIFHKGLLHTNEIVKAIINVYTLETIFSLSPYNSNNNLQGLYHKHFYDAYHPDLQVLVIQHFPEALRNV